MRSFLCRTVAGLALFGLVSEACATMPKSEIQAIIRAEARLWNVPEALALAVARVESNFNAGAESPAGARGVMQIMPATAKGEYGVPADRLWDPGTNIRLGIRFLKQLHNRYDGRWDLALSHYNGGTIRERGANARPHSYTLGYLEKVARWIPHYKDGSTVWAATPASRRQVPSPRPAKQSIPARPRIKFTSAAGTVTLTAPGQAILSLENPDKKDLTIMF